MNCRRTITKAIPLLLSVGLVLSACAAGPHYGAAAYPGVYSGYQGYPYDPVYGSLGLGFGGLDDIHHDRDSGRRREDHEFGQHAGHGLAPFGGHGFAGNIGHGFAGHGGFGGHRA